MTTDIASLVTGFSRSLRGAGLHAPPSATIDFARAVALLGTDNREHVYWAGRACFCRREEDAEPYTMTFLAFFGAVSNNDLRDSRTTPPTPSPALANNGGDADSHAALDDMPFPVAYSAAEILRTKDFARCTEAELAEVARLITSLRRRPPMRRGRRLEPSRASGRGVLDMRRTMQRAFSSGGDPVRLVRRVRGDRPRRVVLLIDASGSMSSYVNTMLRFAHSTIVSQRNVEAFALGTRCTRITRELSWRNLDAALARVASAAPDLKGGTRLGDCLREFNESGGMGGSARGAIVVLISDGFDRGDSAQLAEQMSRLAYAAHRVVWVNPLKASPGYEPLARSMAAALPFADEFLSGHSLEALDELVQVMAR
ncbi:MAG: hypothetical protein JWM55_1674 [Acidimicrobiaceae bacterium]|nr:hypothetical protein [Acidimicrobiaceae bacterium]